MENDFWSLVDDVQEAQNKERAVEIIRRCSSIELFRDVLRRINSTVKLVRGRGHHKRSELIIDGVFSFYTDWLYYDGSISRIVMVDITIGDLRGNRLFKSQLYLVVSISGRITEVFDN